MPILGRLKTYVRNVWHKRPPTPPPTEVTPLTCAPLHVTTTTSQPVVLTNKDYYDKLLTYVITNLKWYSVSTDYAYDESANYSTMYTRLTFFVDNHPNVLTSYPPTWAYALLKSCVFSPTLEDMRQMMLARVSIADSQLTQGCRVYIMYHTLFEDNEIKLEYFNTGLPNSELIIKHMRLLDRPFLHGKQRFTYKNHDVTITDPTPRTLFDMIRGWIASPQWNAVSTARRFKGVREIDRNTWLVCIV